jgi:hypothetical protein
VLPVPILEIDYESLVTDVDTVARTMVSWCGVEWDPACLEFHKTKREVRTASVAQVRQPLYTRSIGRWKNYQHSLSSLFSAIERLGAK